MCSRFGSRTFLTRPLGASTGDLLSQSLKDGGLGLGTTTTSAVFLAVILALVAYLTFRKARVSPASDDTLTSAA